MKKNNQKSIEIPTENLFADYLSYRCSVICGREIINKQELANELKRIILQPSIQSFICDSLTEKKDHYDVYHLHDLIFVLKTEYDMKCLTKEYFLWLDDDNFRLIHYIWRLLSHLAETEMRNAYRISKFAKFGQIKSFAQMDNIIIQEVTKKDIIMFINRLDCSKNNKVRLVEYIKHFSVDSLSNQTLINWFKKNHNIKAPWAFSYLMKRIAGYNTLSIPGSALLKNDIISFFDVLYTFNNDECQNIIFDMKKAWDAKVYREKNKIKSNKKKQYSIKMSHDIDGILNKMCTVQNENKNSLIERLIRAEYEIFDQKTRR